MSEHIDEDLLSRLELGPLPGPEQADLDVHLDGCDGCRSLLASWARAGTSASDPAATPGDPTPPAPLQNTVVAERYVVLSLLGRGSMGAVWLAFDTALERRVALKLIRGDATREPAELEQRLQREAKAMARLAHPDVLAIYDVGRLGERLFIAMEYVDGVTLRAWLLQAQRPWPEVLAVLLHAGEGLRAAHLAGIVHRDFKPDNVLVGRDGRVRVTDFGLALLGLSEPAPAQAAPAPADGPVPAAGGPAPAGGEGSVTESGALLGSPAYMPPERLRGEKADERADVFSFSVATWEALYAERPFPGEDLAAVRRAASEGRVRAPPAGTQVPDWIRLALLRGLAASPGDRWPSMAALLDALRRDPAVRRRRVAAGVAALLVVALGAAGLIAERRGRDAGCTGLQARWAGIWDGARRAALRDAWASSPLPYAGLAADSVGAALDAYAAGWTAMREEACRATRVRGEQSEQLHDLRIHCLDRRLADARALIDLLARADRALITRAQQAVASLPDLSECADARLLLGQAPRPTGAQGAAIHAVEEKLAAAAAEVRAGRYRQAMADLGPVDAEARKLGFAPLETEAALALCRAQSLSGEASAVATCQRSTTTAIRARRDDLAARAWLAVAGVQSIQRDQNADALASCEQAAALIERLGGDPALEALRLNTQGLALSGLGRSDEAIAALQKALALRERAAATDETLLIPTLDRLGSALNEAERYAEAVEAHRRALDVARRRLGAQHPTTINSMSNLILPLSDSGHRAEALALARDTLRLQREALGAAHPNVASTLAKLGMLTHEDGRTDEGVALLREAVAIAEAKLGPAHPRVGSFSVDIGKALVERRRYAEALPPLERAARILEPAQAPPREQADWRFALAEALWGAGGDRSRARALAEKARALFAEGRDPADVGRVDKWLAAREGAQGKGRIH